MAEKIIILDFGSQYTQLIARRVREFNVYCEIHPFYKIPELDNNVKGIILSGSPYSVRQEDSPRINFELFRKIPVLGVCYGAQLMAHQGGGEVSKSLTREYGRANLNFVENESKLLKHINTTSQVWMSHGDTIQQIPSNYTITASTETVKVAAFEDAESMHYGIQFHPEVTHSIDGKTLLHNFIHDICHCSGDWTSLSFIETTIEDIRKTVGNDKVLLGLSGGVDSSVAAVLLHQAIGNQLHCIFVDNGLLRKNEYESVLDSYKSMGLNIRGVNAGSRFLDALKGENDPETKRKIIGRVFIEVFDDAAHEVEEVKWLAQGTIYPDVIESVSVKGPSATIKSHHNVGGLPDYMKLKIIEPLKTLFKDEVRRIGTSLGMHVDLIGRHPFPGPGLAIRILGDITAERVRLLQEADAIFINNLKAEQLYPHVWQAGAILLPIQSVGVMGDERTYEQVICLRAVESVDGMTADWSHLPYEFLARVSNEIINNVKGINRVVYDISSKPPATIEWE